MLVLGASGGVGMAAIDIGQALGLEVVAAAGSPEKLAACKAAGATTLINYNEGDFKTALQEAGIYGKIDIVMDQVGGSWSEPSMRALGWGGRFMVIGFASGGTTPTDAIPKMPLNLALLNERQIIGCFWGVWKQRDGNTQNRANMETMMEMVAAGSLAPLVSRTWPVGEYAKAFEAIMGRAVLGKVTLRVATASSAAAKL
jgi:NADPH2:quinone reductase